jgi:NADPH-dependent glutamate synthase beta subunit-like oxidoreductase
MSQSGASGPDLRKLVSYKDLPIGASSIGLEKERSKTGSWRFFRPVMAERVPPCEIGCPMGVPIRSMLRLARERKWLEAWQSILDENPFPSICGRVCYHPCEAACHRGNLDEPTAIQLIERKVGEYGLKEDKLVRPRSRSKKGRRIAIVGAGPAGLACAYFLGMLGYHSVVFEALSARGGMMHAGIPEFRLPTRILNREIARIEKLGVQFELNQKLGKDFTFEDLSPYHAIFLSVGAFVDRTTSVPGNENEGVISGLEFLRSIKGKKKIKLGKRVVIIGGGNTAMDCARTAVRLGTHAEIFYRRSREEMPAFQDEIVEAGEEGVKFHFLVSPTRILGQRGRIKAVEFRRNKLGKKGPDGRKTVTELRGSDFTINADSVILATGEISDLSGISAPILIEDDKVFTDRGGATSLAGVYAGGDMIAQPHSVANAAASGKRAAMSIDLYLAGGNRGNGLTVYERCAGGPVSFRRYLEGQDSSHRLDVAPFESLALSYFHRKARNEERKTASSGRRKGFKEVKLGLARNAVSIEANRCLGCGSCIECNNCFNYCPDSSVLIGAELSIDYDYCKGCGICENECPAGFIHMEREPGE